MSVWIAAVLALALVAAPPAAAHIPYFEPEMVTLAGADWSLDAPFEIPLGEGYSPLITTSRAIQSVLGASPGDLYDAAAFNVSADGPAQTVVGLYALTPGCDAFADLYPSVALLGPTSDPRFKAPPAGTALPFEVPAGYGAIIVDQPRVERGVFADGPIRYNLPGPLADWENCITSAEALRSCDPGNEASLTMDASLAPGRYYVAWWDPERTSADAPAPAFPHEVIINLGVTEDATPKEQEIQGQVMGGQVRPLYAQCLAGAFGPTPGGAAGGMPVLPAPMPAPMRPEAPPASGAAAKGAAFACSAALAGAATALVL